MSDLTLYNTLTRTKQPFIPLNPPFVGMYVCGPTVYGNAHLGHSRSAITFDLLFRYLKQMGYKVRYVRNITDVGHLENDADEGDDKILKKAKLDRLEPMEIVQQFTDNFHRNMEQLNVLKPSIEPRASGHIIEQQEMIHRIIEEGYGYVVNGSVYFDIDKYHKKYHYGKLSGRVLEDLLTHTRELEGKSDKRGPFDFALWKKAEAEHIMRWPSAWGEGFPGWHLECSAMSARYLGTTFDIHGGGMDLLFPHHECEIAQSTIANGHEAVRYWIHNNMITIGGQKMGKSLGNFITLDELFSGNHPALHQPYGPMTIRFFMLQAHYRSTLDFSNEALQASEKGLERLLKVSKMIPLLKVGKTSSINVKELSNRCFEALNDDLNTPVLIAHLFEGVRLINLINDEKESVSESDKQALTHLFHLMVDEILGLKPDQSYSTDTLSPALIDLLLALRTEAKTQKDFATSDRIRNDLANLGVLIKDTKKGTEWEKA